MSTSTNPKRIPYGPPATILQVIHHFEHREVPETLTDTQLGQIGVKASVLGIVKQALVFLNLIRDDGTTTDNFRALRFASDEERVRLFREIVTSSYADIIAIHDPETATRSQLFNAFRPYSPASQQDRMITLFLTLCQEAGMKIGQAPRQSATQTGSRSSTVRKTPIREPRVNGILQGQLNNPPPVNRSGFIFGVTEEDIAALTEGEFDEVWTA